VGTGASPVQAEQSSAAPLVEQRIQCVREN